jgi:beta-glucosidase
MEHYGHDFRIAIQEGGVLSVMNAYNLINGTHCSENQDLLKTILRDRWGFPFYVVSDWGAVHNSKNAIQAGTDICMGSSHYENDLENLLNAGLISEANIDAAVNNVLRTKAMAGMLGLYPKAGAGLINSEEHQQLALESARKAMILLKNENNILPIDVSNSPRIALIGPSANKAQLDGFGSSWVEPIYTVSPREGITQVIGSGNITYSQGCDINSSDTSRFSAARVAAMNADYVVYVGGLDDTQEGEGYGDRPEYDRKGGSIQLPGKQQELINELAKVNDNIIVVIKSGGICGMERCIDNIKGFIYAFYPGQEGGNALADVLFGFYNPGGKLPVTMPKGDYQLPAWNDNFNDDFGCGYRWFDQFQIEPQFVFGHGLSYTQFEYSDIRLTSPTSDIGEPIIVSVDISNTGTVKGEEVAQLYISVVEPSVWMPEKQLKGFQRVEILPGETVTVNFELTAQDFYYWDESTDSYQVEPGIFVARVGGSSGDLTESLPFAMSEGIKKPDLEISRIFTLPRFPVEGDSVHLFAYLRNIGADVLTHGRTVEIDFHHGNEKVGTFSSDKISIPTGGMKMIELEDAFWIPNNDGMFDISASIDPDNLITEAIEVNNQYVQEIHVLDSSVLILNNNLALNKPVQASSSESVELVPHFGVDGNSGTRWSSLFYDPQEYNIDLEGVFDIIQIRIQWETAYSKSFKIEVSENSIDWEEVIFEDDSDGNVDEFNIDATARYIRFTGIERATEWGHSFYEFEVYGKQHQSVVSVQENQLSFLDDVQIFPNPVSDIMYFSQLPTGFSFDLTIYDVKGVVMIQKKINSNESIDLTQFKSGNYFLHFEHEDSTRILKIIKN